MNRRFFVLFLLCAVSLITVNVQAQSGRKGTTQPAPKPGVKTDSPSSTTTDGAEGITESRTIPGGETVEGDVIRVDTSLVTVPVTVIDRNGRYVPQLRRENFRIFEDGVEQKLAYFATSDQPFTVILVIDTSGSTQFRLEDIQDAAIAFVGKLKTDDSVMVMSFDDRIDVLIRPTTDRNQIARAIRRTRTGGGTRLYDAVDDILNKQLRTIAGRKAVVLFTDGVDTTSRRATYDSTVRLAEESEAPIYSVDYDTSGATGVWGGGMPGTRGGIIFGIPVPRPGGTSIPGSSPGDYRRATAYLHALCDNTGGRFYSGDSMFGIGQAFAWIAEELGRQYSLGYYPKILGQNGQRRQIKVKVDQAELVVKARGSYIYSAKKPNTNTNHPTEKTQPPDKQPYISDAGSNWQN